MAETIEPVIRAFIALSLPPTVQQTILLLMDELRSVPVRWVEHEALHVTLKFLGEISREQVDMTIQALISATRNVPPFRVRLQSLGCFPTTRNPRVLWIGLDDAEQRLRSLQQRLTEALQSYGFGPDQHPFHPHVTLGRFRTATQKIAPFLDKYREHVFAERIDVNTVDLFQSQLYSHGPVYTKIHSHVLQDTLL